MSTIEYYNEYAPTEVPIKEVFTNGNIRPNGDKGQFEALRDNIEEVGQIVPITVYHEDKKYWVLTGHQRLRALKNLRKDTVKISVVDKPEDSTHSLIQYSENMFRVDMSLYDQVQAMRKVSKENPDLTYEQLSARFGKNVKWVSSRMAIANLVKDLYNKAFINENEIEELVEIGSYSQEIQSQAIQTYCLRHNISLAEFRDAVKHDEISSWRLARALEVSYLNEEQMAKLFSEEELEECWATYKHKKESTNLFDEVEIQYDLGFFEYCAKMIYPDRLAELNEIPMDESLRSWDPLTKQPSLHNIFTVSSKTFSKYKAWNGNFTELVFQLNPKASVTSSSDDTTEVVEKKSKFHGCGTKLARALMPEYYKYVTNTAVYNESSIEWLRGLGYPRSIGDINGRFLQEALPNHGYNELGTTFLNEYITHLINMSTIKELDAFALLHHRLGIKDWTNDQFKLLTKKELRESILSAFKVDHLKTAYNGEGSTKSDLVKSISSKESTFKFNAIFKDKGANFWEQNCRVHFTEYL